MTAIYNRLPTDIQERIDTELLKEKNICNKKVFDELRLRFKRMAVYNSLTTSDMVMGMTAEDWYNDIFDPKGGFDEYDCDGTISDTCRGCGWTPQIPGIDCVCPDLDWRSSCVKYKHK